jgi:hypothetical protein
MSTKDAAIKGRLAWRWPPWLIRDTLVLTTEYCREAFEVLRGFFRALIGAIPD